MQRHTNTQKLHLSRWSKPVHLPPHLGFKLALTQMIFIGSLALTWATLVPLANSKVSGLEGTTKSAEGSFTLRYHSFYSVAATAATTSSLSFCS
jgi:hypothetical protein